MLSLAYDGLVAYRRIPGAGGSTLVADLAASVPQPSDGGRTYTFQLRPGLRFSDGTPVRPEDFRASIERVVRLAGQARRTTAASPAPARAARGGATSPKGIETDAAARTITIHLRRPDAEFVHKLALPLAYVLPAHARRRRSSARVPRREPARTRSPRSHRDAACGSCATRAFARGRRRRAPTGSPTRSTSRSPATPLRRWPPCSTAARTPSSPPATSAASLSLDQDRALELAAPNRVHTGPAPTTSYLFVNVRERPFDDPRVRRALNYAVDRRRTVELAGGSGLAGLSCQLIPPGLPGYAPTCPFTRDAVAGRWLVGAGSRPRSPADRGVRHAGSAGAGVGTPEIRGRRPLRRRGPAAPGLPRPGTGAALVGPTSTTSTTRGTTPRWGSRAGSTIS